MGQKGQYGLPSIFYKTENAQHNAPVAESHKKEVGFRRQWCKKRNRNKSDIECRFTRQDVDKKLSKY